MDPMSSPAIVRLLREPDLDQLTVLMNTHAAYEGAPPPATDPDRLRSALLDQRSATCFVAASRTTLIGYATLASEFSTWNATSHAHLDTLFVDETSRGRGVGKALFDAVRAHAEEFGACELQWQTPAWNHTDVRFHDRTGATRALKHRFSLPLDRRR